MELETLHIFLDVMRLGSFAAVARARHVAPSSVSRAIASLEEALGVRLFQRSTRRLTPTEAGLRYHERVAPLLCELARAGEALRAEDAALDGTLRVTAPVSFSQRHITPLLPALTDAHPALRIEVLSTDALLDLIAARVDVAVRLGPPRDSSMRARRLGGMGYTLCASPDYLARHGAPTHPEQLTAHQCLWYPVPGQTPTWRFRRVDARGVEIDHAAVPVSGPLTIDNGVALRDCALAGLGVVLLPWWLVDEALADDALVPLCPSWTATASAFDAGVWLMFPSGDPIPRRARVFADALQRAFRDARAAP